jgi:nucleotide-binding universal stress UspA family protein
MEINRIVVAVDFSAESQSAVEQAMNVARKNGAELVLLHVCGVPDKPNDVPDAMRATLNVYEEMLREQLSEVRRQLDELGAQLSGQGVEISHVVREGFPDSAIVETARELHADLIVTGSHGRTGFARFLMGSVAERVVRLSEVPVLVARAAAGESAAGGYHRIAVAVDFSDITDEVISAALAVAARGAQVDVLHAWEMSPLSYQAMVPVKAAQDLVQPLKDSLRGAATERGAELITRHEKEDVTITFHAVEGRAADVVEDWLKDHPVSLVVTGSHGRRGLRRFILGSVAENIVRHSACSALVVHSRHHRHGHGHGGGH